ncbi:MAG: EscU/YscU/HrcU family type III secretion system export apparatus switch protein [Succinivibrionaceae bacterium]|nr:EscU/YscU/HrcU family type III secretion system export apparatus switch protein [Succinivibrionaceae bacterium]
MDDKKVISVSYNQERNAPEVTGKASGLEAEDIIAMAEKAGVYVHQDPVLLSHLDEIPEGSSIPRELYAIMAEILAYSYVLQGKFPEQWRRPDGTVAINRKA